MTSLPAVTSPDVAVTLFCAITSSPAVTSPTVAAILPAEAVIFPVVAVILFCAIISSPAVTSCPAVTLPAVAATLPVVAVTLFCAITSSPAVTSPAVAETLPVVAVTLPSATTFLSAVTSRPASTSRSTSRSPSASDFIAQLAAVFKNPISPLLEYNVLLLFWPSKNICAGPALSPIVRSPSIVILPVAVSSASLLKNCAASNPSTVSASKPLPGPSSAVVIIRPSTALLTSNCQ